jgi:hypothetical protein
MADREVNHGDSPVDNPYESPQISTGPRTAVKAMGGCAVAALVALSSGIAFCCVCVGTGFLSLAIDGDLGISLIIGMFAAAIVGVFVYQRLTRRAANAPTPAAGDEQPNQS